MATADLLGSEWAARDLRPVARWAPVTEPDGRRRLVMTWSVPEPVVPELSGVPRLSGVPESLPAAGA